jgi:hypothetical protein
MKLESRSKINKLNFLYISPSLIEFDKYIVGLYIRMNYTKVSQNIKCLRNFTNECGKNLFVFR